MSLVPTYRLIQAAALVLLPGAFVFAYAPQYLVAFVALGAIVLLVIVLDGAQTIGKLDQVRTKLPETIRATRGIAANVPITIEAPDSTPRLLYVGLAFPPAVRSAQDSLLIRLPSDATTSTVSWNVTPLERGHFPIDRVYLGANSALGFWEHRRAAPASGTFRVYPNVQRERRNLAALFLDRAPFGVHARRFTGKGREFEQLREYVPGDSYDDIHWKASARRGEPITKTYQVERTQEVYVLIDSSRTSSSVLGTDREGNGVTNLERCITASLVLGLAAELQGDLFGVMTFDSRVNRFIKARNGRGHYNACRDAIYDVEPSADNPDFAELFSFIRVRLRKRALIIVLANLGDPLLAEEFMRHVELVSRNHLILAISVKDPEVAPLFSSETTSTIDDVYARLGGHLEWSNLQRIKQALHARNVTLSFAPHEALSTELVSQYLRQKERQLL